METKRMQIQVTEAGRNPNKQATKKSWPKTIHGKTKSKPEKPPGAKAGTQRTHKERRKLISQSCYKHWCKFFSKISVVFPF